MVLIYVVCDVETDDCLPPVGTFVLQVDDSNETVVGGTRYPFNVESCPTDFYDNGDGACVLCLEHVSCTNGSTISDWKLDENYWRPAAVAASAGRHLQGEDLHRGVADEKCEDD